MKTSLFILLFAVIVAGTLFLKQDQQNQGAVAADIDALVQWAKSDEPAFLLECRGEHPACHLNEADHPYSLQFVLPAITAHLTPEDRAVLLAKIEAEANNEGHYAHSPSFAYDSDVTASAFVAMGALGKQANISVLDDFLCPDAAHNLPLYGTFLQADIRCDGAGFDTKRPYREKIKDYDPTVIASVLRVQKDNIPPETFKALVDYAFPYWARSLFYHPVISSYFWLEALPPSFAEQRREICTHLADLSADTMTPADTAIAAYNLSAHCAATPQHPLIKSALSGRAAADPRKSPFWYFDGSSPDRVLYVEAYDSGVIEKAMTLRLKQQIQK